MLLPPSAEEEAVAAGATTHKLLALLLPSVEAVRPASGNDGDDFFPNVVCLRMRLVTVVSWSASCSTLAEVVCLREEPRDGATTEGELGGSMHCVRLGRIQIDLGKHNICCRPWNAA